LTVWPAVTATTAVDEQEVALPPVTAHDRRLATPSTITVTVYVLPPPGLPLNVTVKFVNNPLSLTVAFPFVVVLLGAS
jgi:hypothetical protein